MSIQFARLPQANLSVLYGAEPTPTFHTHTLNASILLRSVLHRDQVELLWLDELFRLDADLEILKHPFIEFLISQGSHQPTNGRTVRLRDLNQVHSKRIRLTLQSASYFDYMITNWAASQNYAVEQADGQLVPIRDLIEPGPALMPLPQARAANQTGVVCLFLCEGHLLGNQRGRQITDSGLWGLSASGTLQNDGPATSPFDHVLTELEEETGLTEDFVDADSLRLIGIAREFHRAGKPEMYFIVQGRKSLAETKARVAQRSGADAWEAVRSDWLSIEALLRLDGLQDRRIQPSAEIGLWFLLDWLRTSGSAGDLP